MDKVGGPLGVTAIAVVAALLVCLAVLHFGFHAFRRRKARPRVKSVALHESKSGVMNDSRVEVLETTIIDAERKLVLIRCDRIEHLIMIGGPADVVVENDVRKVRGPGAPPAKIPGFDTEKRAPAVQRPAAPVVAAHDSAIAPTPKAPEPHRPAPRAAETRPTPAPRSVPANPPARAGARNGDGHTPPPVEPAHRAPPQRPQPVDPQFGRRDAAPVRRAQPTATHPTAPAARASDSIRVQPSSASDRNARATRVGGRIEPAAGLPAAQIPWSDPDSIENEIVRALRFDPNTRGNEPAAAGRREPPSAKAMTDSHTTLGDLADRLEEALAREVQSARQPQAPAADEFGFDNEPAKSEAEPPKPAIQKDRPERRERSEPQRAAAAPAPEADTRREPPAPPERREEAPVISLNSRRRESADQLEDEMARLLGELTSDNKGR